MPAKKISDEAVLKKTEYRSILSLLQLSGAYSYQTGWTAGQLLYALSEKPEANTDHEQFVQSIETRWQNVKFVSGKNRWSENYAPYKKFSQLYEKKTFSDTGNDIYFIYSIVERWIGERKPRQASGSKLLNDKLKFLISRGWVTTGTSKPRYYRYYLTGKYWVMKRQQSMDQSTSEYTQTGIDGIDVYYPKGTSWQLFGFPKEIIDKMSGDNYKRFVSCIKTINKKLCEIADMKYDVEPIKPLTWDDYYRLSLFMTVNRYGFVNKKKKKKS